MAQSKSSRPSPRQSYQALSEQLDGAMAKLQNPDVNIDDAVKHYEAALELIEKMEAYLKTAENRIREIRAAIGEKNK